MIMGRKTFESLPGLLPRRTHIVITRQKEYSAENCIVTHSLNEAVKIAYTKDKSPFIIGGGEIYRQSMAIANVIELTRVHTEIEADTFFPEIDESKWYVHEKEFYAKDATHKYDFTFITYKRK